MPATRGPFTVERHDNQDGSIAYEIWTHDLQSRVLRMRDDDNKNAKADAELIAHLLNNQHPIASPATIAELDAILNSEDDRPIKINPDGSITKQ